MRELAQYLVAAVMPVGVVDLFEMIDVDERERQRSARSLRTHHLTTQELQDAGAIPQSREGIASRPLEQGLPLAEFFFERDPAGAAAMFTTGLYGVYATLDKVSRAASASTDPGSLAGSIARYQSKSKDISEETAKLADQQEALRASMVARFAKADTQIGQSKSTLSFLQSQIAAWNAQKD